MHTTPKLSHNRIYLDYAAATPLHPRVFDAMMPYWQEVYGNAGALHTDGVRAREAIEQSRARCAAFIGAIPEEIIFTSGGTESNNLALFGVFEQLLKEGRRPEDMHFISLSIEHSSVGDCLKVLEKKGVNITQVSAGENGVVSVENIMNALKENTVLISVMLVNSEIGTIQPICELAKKIRQYRKEKNTRLPYLHTDASQAPAYISVKEYANGADLITVDAQKMYGPKGSGFLYVKKGVSLSPILYGGTQERGMRPGTPVTPLIVGFAEACDLVEAQREEKIKEIRELRQLFLDEVLAHIPHTELNGDREKRIAGNVNISFVGQESEYILYALDVRGISVSTRSACLGGTGGGSFVVRSLGKGDAYALSSVRFSFGYPTTREEIEYTIKALKDIYSTL